MVKIELALVTELMVKIELALVTTVVANDKDCTCISY